MPLVACIVVDMTNAQLDLREAGGRIGAQVTEGNYRVRLMGWKPGAEYVEGSSALYPVSVIQRDFAEAFPVGTRMRADHDGFCESGGSIKRIIGKTTTPPVAEEDGMYADAYVSEEWQRWFEEFADVIGTSISTAADVEMVEVEDPRTGEVESVPRLQDGKKVVERFWTAEENPYNAVDFVEAPGADGRITQRITQALEAAKKTHDGLDIRHQAAFVEGLPHIRQILKGEKLALETSEAAPPQDNQEGTSMDPKLLAALEALGNGSFATQIIESVTAAVRPEVPADRASTGTVAEAVIAAGLSEAGRQAVYEAHDRGEDYTVALERETKREKDIRESIAASAHTGSPLDEFETAGVTHNESTGTGLLSGLLAESAGEDELDKLVRNRTQGGRL